MTTWGLNGWPPLYGGEAFFIMTEIPFFVQSVLFCGGAGVGLLIGILIGAQLTESYARQRKDMEQQVFQGTVGTIDLP